MYLGVSQNTWVWEPSERFESGSFHYYAYMQHLKVFIFATLCCVGLEILVPKEGKFPLGGTIMVSLKLKLILPPGIWGLLYHCTNRQRREHSTSWGNCCLEEQNGGR